MVHSTLSQVEECLTTACPDIIMLDNMPCNIMRKAVAMRKQKASDISFEASGNITKERLRDVADTGIDYISCGNMTYAPPPVDISMDIRPLVL